MISVGKYYDDTPVCREQLSRRLLEVVWLLHHGLTREKVAQIVGIGLATVGRHAKAYWDGGPDGLRHWGKKGQVSSLEAHRELLAETFRERPVSSVAEAADLVRALEEVHAFRPDSHLDEALTVCAALGGTDLDALLRAASDIRASVQVAPLRAAGLEGAALGRALADARRIKLQEAQQARVTPDSE